MTLNGRHRWARIGVQDQGNHRLAGAIMAENNLDWIEPCTIDQIEYDFSQLESGATYHISSEIFSHPRFLRAEGPEFLKNLLNRVTFVFCVREQVSLINSTYLQILKRGLYGKSPDIFVKDHALSQSSNVFDTAKRYAKLAPVQVINYHENRVLENYAQITGCGVDRAAALKRKSHNVSGSFLSAAAANRLIFPANPLEDGPWETNDLVSLAEEMFPGEKMALSGELVELLKNRYREGNRLFAEEFGVDLNAHMEQVSGTKKPLMSEEVDRAARALAVRLNRDRSHLNVRVLHLEQELQAKTDAVSAGDTSPSQTLGKLKRLKRMILGKST